MAEATAPAPVLPSHRISSLDVLRGFALLGILLMNVQSFSMPIAAYSNPTAYGDFSGANVIVWFLVHLFADQKMMTLFSILFGAGIILMTGRAEERTGSSAAIHYRRMFWLLLFGLAHAYLLWYGDILFTYALAAMILFPFRRAAPRKLLIAGLLVFFVPTLIGVALAASAPTMPAEDLASLRNEWSPGPDLVAAELAAYQGGWSAQQAHRAPFSLYVETEFFLFFWGWKAAGLMLIGMSLFKFGILSASRSARTYGRMILGGFSIGIPLILTGAVLNIQAGWTFEASLWTSHFNYWGSLAMATAYIGVLMRIVQSDALRAVQARLAAVGRTAFTNYLLQTVLCTTIFYGHGLGLFGSVDRATQLLFVLGVWTVQLVASPWWLKHFTLGPFEWAWRSLTYLRVQRLRPTPATPGAPA